MVAKAKFAKAEVVSATFELKKSRYPYVLVPCTYDVGALFCLLFTFPDISGEELPFWVTFESSAEVTAQLISKEREWPSSIQVFINSLHSLTFVRFFVTAWSITVGHRRTFTFSLAV